MIAAKLSMLARGFAVATMACGVVGSAAAQSGVTDVEIRCDGEGLRCRQVAASFSLPGEIAGSLLLSFADATQLTEKSLDITAEIVDPRDPELTSRLPRGTFIPSDFPVLVQVEPVRGGGLSFRRNWTLELSTGNLAFSSHTPFRLFRAPDGGAFEDISFSLGSGSLRVRGAGGRFSEFLIAADLRPIQLVVARKLASLRATVDAVRDDIGDTAGDLDKILDQTQQLLEAGNLPRAVEGLDQFLALVESRSGTDIPDDTRPGDEVEGAAARLLSKGMTLRHSIFLGLQSAQGGMSGFSTRLGVGDHSVDVRLELSGAYVIDQDDFEITGEIVDVNDPALTARLPAGVHVPEELPVLIRIHPKAGARQAFSGAFDLELETESLRFVGGTPLRLFKAPDGGAFEDITRTYGLGGLRVRGAGGRFSEFLIAEDMRPADTVIGRKLEAVAEAIEDNANEISSAVRVELEAALGQVRQNVEQGRYDDALAGIQALVATITAAAGESIPALWRSDEAVTNVAGELVSRLSTLAFSLELRNSPTAAAPGDVNGDGLVDVGDVFFLIDQVFGGSKAPVLLFPPSADDER